jgi:hypothetical protein
MSAMRPGGPPMPEDGLSIEIKGAATLRPIEALPPIRDVDLNLNVTGRTVTLQASHGTLELPSGRKLNLSNAVFNVADTHVKPSQARLRMRVDGSVDGVAELAAIEPLRSNTGVVLDPSSVRGTIAAQLTLGFPLHKDAASALTYNVEGDVTNFVADKLVRGQRVEAQTLRVNVNPDRFQVKGEARIGATMVSLDYRKPKGDADAEARAQMVLDDGARRRLGFDLGGAVTGPIPIKFGGRIASNDGGVNRFAVDADLTQAQITDLLPGWRKPASRPARATFILIERDGARRFEDMVLEGSGALVRGSLDVDATGEIVGANFPVFTFTDSDKASLKVDRAADGTLKIALRGDVFDGHGFIKSLTGADAKPPQPMTDIDLELKLGAVAGFNGEAMRGLDLRMSRRAGEIRSLTLNARLGRDAPLTADLRSGGRGRQIVFIDSTDAGALLRFADLYPRMYGGRMTVQMDPPTADRAPSNGVLTVNSFIIRGEAALDRVAASGPADPGNLAAGRSHGVEFSRMRMDFTRSPGKLSVREGVVWGPAVGATMDGNIDFARQDVHLRGTFVPAYALNNILPRMFAPVPVLGEVLGGANAGLVGVTYEVVGPPNGMMLRVNPVSAVMPGILRKLFEFRGPDERAFVPTEQPYR